jgi:hypothetical protein
VFVALVVGVILFWFILFYIIKFNDESRRNVENLKSIILEGFKCCKNNKEIKQWYYKVNNKFVSEGFWSTF